jgi:hypothetical protein
MQMSYVQYNDCDIMMNQSRSIDEFLEDFEELIFGDFTISILVDGLNELGDLFTFDVAITTETLKSIVD